MSNPKIKNSCALQIAVLRYLMAADAESLQHIEALEARHLAIQWEDPDFIALTEIMRGEKAPPDEGDPNNLAIQAIAAMSYAKETEATLSEALTEAVTFSKRTVDQLERLSELVEKMKDRLRMLGDDTSEFELPQG